MCIYYRFTCRSCSLIQNRVLPCQVAHLPRKYCEVIKEVPPTPQLLSETPPTCRSWGIPQAQLSQQPSQSTSSQQPQCPLQIRRGVDLEGSLEKYRGARGQVFARAEEAIAKKKTERMSGGFDQEREGKETAFEKAWRQLRADMEKA